VTTKPRESRAKESKAKEPKAVKVATPWGAAVVADEVRVAQRSGERRFATIVQLLESGEGEPLVRFAYTTDGLVRRGPVTLRARDLERLRDALVDRTALGAALGLGGGGA
jgi:hypothetical protein